MSEEKNTQQQQSNQWVQQQYAKATKYLAEKGIITKSVNTKESRYLVPVIAVWKLQDNNNKLYWVISGDVPCDHIDFKAATNVRDAVRNFSMKWQMQAENILQTAKDKTQHDFARLLIGRAEGLYQLFEQDKLWDQQASS